MPQLGRGRQLVEINGDIYAFSGYVASYIANAQIIAMALAIYLYNQMTI